MSKRGQQPHGTHSATPSELTACCGNRKRCEPSFWSLLRFCPVGHRRAVRCGSSAPRGERYGRTLWADPNWAPERITGIYARVHGRRSEGSLEDVATAQEVFDDMVRSGITPRLQALGFRRSGTTFVLPSRTHHALLGLQKSAFSDRDALKFTVNITVANVETWEAARAEEPRLPKKPAPNTFYGSFIWQSRIGALLPDGQDRWWWLAADEDWRPVADEVVEAIGSFAIPAVLERLQ